MQYKKENEEKINDNSNTMNNSLKIYDKFPNQQYINNSSIQQSRNVNTLIYYENPNYEEDYNSNLNSNDIKNNINPRFPKRCGNESCLNILGSKTYKRKRKIEK